MTTTANLGFPRIGAGRELKWALERAWRDDRYDDLRAVAAALRQRNWTLQGDRDIGRVPVGDFSLYDHVLDAALAVGVVPERFGGSPLDTALSNDDDMRRYFAMARGGAHEAGDLAPLELTKWFGTNYHYLVPELTPDQVFTARPERLLSQFEEARPLGRRRRPVLLGPVTLLGVSKRIDGGNPLALMGRLLPAYAGLVERLRDAGATAFQFDEPLLITDLPDGAAAAYRDAYECVRDAAGDAEVTLATYFGSLADHTELATSLPIDVIHLDLVSAPDQLDAVVANRPESIAISLGLVDGRNIWRSNLDALVSTVTEVIDHIGRDAVHLAPSCSLVHIPVDVTAETALDPELRSWLAFATQRLDEVRVLRCTVDGDAASVLDELEANRRAIATRRASSRVHRPDVERRVASVTPEMEWRPRRYAERRARQAQVLELPALPTTTIGSFPQTGDLRLARRQLRNGEIEPASYEAVLRAMTEDCIRAQEELGLDVLVHGEFERTDMVEYFGEQLDGFSTTTNGWVQSYGSRCVKPPVLYGDIARPAPMTVEWTRFAAGLTTRPVKGMLTGPVTMLQWSFVRDDQPRERTCRQLGLALRDEVDDLIAAGVLIVQVDEPALREGLPLRRSDHDAYLAWATESFRLSTSSVPDHVQVHTHMCYAEFADIIDAIVDLDADVISMEASRSHMEVLDDFAGRAYPNEIGPGIWDIHSPRVPSAAELDEQLRRAADVFGPDRLWVNPDCGLKTRSWPEVHEALAAMVAAAERARVRL